MTCRGHTATNGSQAMTLPDPVPQSTAWLMPPCIQEQPRGLEWLRAPCPPCYLKLSQVGGLDLGR